MLQDDQSVNDNRLIAGYDNRIDIDFSDLVATISEVPDSHQRPDQSLAIHSWLPAKVRE
jgi:hypothetical protein